MSISPAARNLGGSVRPNSRSAPRGQQRPERTAQSIAEYLGRPVFVRAEQRLQRGVGVLDDQPSARSHRVDQGRERRVALRDMGEQEPCVDEVERAGRLIGSDIVPQHLVPPGGGEPAGVDVGRDDPPARPDLVGEPRRDARTAGADLPAVPARPQAGRQKVTMSPRVEQLGQRPESGARLCLRVVQEVNVVGHASIVPVIGSAGRPRRPTPRRPTPRRPRPRAAETPGGRHVSRCSGRPGVC